MPDQKHIRSVYSDGKDVIWNVRNRFTNELESYTKVTTWHDGTAMDDSKVDNFIYRKRGDEYFAENNDTIVNVKRFGAVGDGITDDTSNIQSAINICNILGYTLFFPKGIYCISSPLILPTQNLKNHIFGSGIQRTTIKVISETIIDGVFIFDDAVNSRSHYIKDITIYCEEKAKTGVRSYSINHSIIDNVAVWKSTEASFDLSYGWCIDFYTCQAIQGLLHGFLFGKNGPFSGEMNNLNLVGCRSYQNGGFGFYIKQSRSIKMTECLMELNASGGAYLVGNKGVYLDTCYFESNYLNGHTFSNLTGVVKADVILNGNGDDTLAGVIAPNYGISVKNSHISTRSDVDAFVFAGSVFGLSVSDNYLNTNIANEMAVVKTTVDRLKTLARDVYVGRNQNFFENFNISELASTTKTVALRTFDSPESRRLIIGENDISKWIVSGPGTITKEATKINGNDVFTLTTDTTTTSSYYFNVVSENFPELHGKACYFACSVSVVGGSSYINANGSQSRTASGSAYFRNEAEFIFPSTGTFIISIVKTGSAGSISFYDPVIAEVGAHEKSLQRVFTPEALASADTAAAAPATYDQTHIQDLIDEVRDLKSKLRDKDLLAT